MSSGRNSRGWLWFRPIGGLFRSSFPNPSLFANRFEPNTARRSNACSKKDKTGVVKRPIRDVGWRWRQRLPPSEYVPGLPCDSDDHGYDAEPVTPARNRFLHRVVLQCFCNVNMKILQSVANLCLLAGLVNTTICFPKFLRTSKDLPCTRESPDS